MITRTKQRFISLSILFFLLYGVMLAQSTSIENVIKNPKTYEGDEVSVEGLALQYTTGKGTTSYYLLKGDFGGIIKVNTSEPAPETNKKYLVTGIVYRDRSTREAFISEKGKTIIGETPPQPQHKPTPTPEPAKEDSTMIYLITFLAIILLGLIIYAVTRNKKEKPAEKIPPRVPIKNQFVEPEPKFTNDNDYKTIKIVKSSPKTLKFIPGKLEITSGADKGKDFRIVGYPTPEGSIISIGRKDVKGDRAYAHIYLKEMTVSRDQAEIISKDGKLFVKNLSETNLTQLDGVELKLGQMAEAKPNSTIRTGEVEFKYIL